AERRRWRDLEVEERERSHVEQRSDNLDELSRVHVWWASFDAADQTSRRTAGNPASPLHPSELSDRGVHPCSGGSARVIRHDDVSHVDQLRSASGADADVKRRPTLDDHYLEDAATQALGSEDEERSTETLGGRAQRSRIVSATA